MPDNAFEPSSPRLLVALPDESVRRHQSILMRTEIVGMGLVTAALLGLSGCAHVGPRVNSASYIELPPLPTLVHVGEKLEKVEVIVNCAGVSGVDGVPDGWLFSGTMDGETYKVTIAPDAHVREPQFGKHPPRIALAFRGQWSDCYGVHAVAYFSLNGISGSREFHAEEFLGPLLEGPAK